MLILILALLNPLAHADEGMWLFNKFPASAVAKKYGFIPTPEWLDHLRFSSARLAGGCSGSFVSDNGLVMTNHHCAHSCIEQLSSKDKDFVSSGYYAKSEKEEVKCPEIEVNRLDEITDVTTKVRAATKGLSGKAYNDALKRVSTEIEQACAAGKDSARCDVVDLYHGGAYNLYRYHRYQDVRLVFAPEISAAFFGGDPDNFMFPRYDLDVSFLRVYDQGAPLLSKDHFRWSKTPAKAGDLTFVTGHPGRTSRLLTMAQLEFDRDVKLVRSLIHASELRGFLTSYMQGGPEQHRNGEHALFGIENQIKANKGRQNALADPSFFESKRKAEQELRRRVNANPEWKKKYAGAWSGLETAVAASRKIFARFQAVEENDLHSHLFGYARSIVRGAEELPKPSEKRLREFTESRLPQLKQELFSDAPIYDDFEMHMLSFGLTKLREDLTADDPLVKKLFGKKSPDELARELVSGTSLRSVAARQALWNGGAEAVKSSGDPMIQFARAFEPEARQLRDTFEDEIDPLFKASAEKIAQAQFAVYGDKVYPDATFTLRLSFGAIEGYTQDGRKVDPITHIGGAFERHTGRDPYALPASWLAAKDQLQLSTPLNFASTNDIVGGNSGSPVVNKEGEIVGLIFDGNIQSLGGTYGFDPKVNRAVSVHSAGLLEALKNVYHADRVVKDLSE
jgi:hypothetical protein